MVMLILGFFTGITLLLALILSAIAMSAYKNYENPSFLERRTIALVVFIISLILVILGVIFLGFWLYLLLFLI